ncbi:hypothetical protein ACNKHO_17535 [Shigella flexneri]
MGVRESLEEQTMNMAKAHRGAYHRVTRHACA